MKRRQPPQPGRTFLAVFCLVMILSPGCGAGPAFDFANRLIGAEGELIVTEDVDLIVQDPSLSVDEKRSALRSLGIEDEELIDALLTL